MIGPCDLCPTLIDRFRTRRYCDAGAVKAQRAVKKRYAQKPDVWERERKRLRERKRKKVSPAGGGANNTGRQERRVSFSRRHLGASSDQRST